MNDDNGAFVIGTQAFGIGNRVRCLTGPPRVGTVRGFEDTNYASRRPLLIEWDDAPGRLVAWSTLYTEHIEPPLTRPALERWLDS